MMMKGSLFKRGFLTEDFFRRALQYLGVLSSSSKGMSPRSAKATMLYP